MNEIKQITDYAANQSDRWLFIAALVVLLLVVALIWKWMVGHVEKVSKRLEAVTDRHIAQGEHMATVVANNTSALEESAQTNRELKSLIERRFQN